MTTVTCEHCDWITDLVDYCDTNPDCCPVCGGGILNAGTGEPYMQDEDEEEEEEGNYEDDEDDEDDDEDDAQPALYSSLDDDYEQEDTPFLDPPPWSYR